MSNWFNDNDAFACSVLRARIAEGRLPAGVVDDRSITEVAPNDIHERTQVHLFAGIGGFAYACRLAELPDNFDIWTGGFPCQDISCAGKGVGLHGGRSGMFFEIVRLLHGVKRRPRWLLLENVPAILGRGLDRVLDELAGAGYTCWPIVMGAWSVGAPHKRDRVWIVCRLVNTERTGVGWQQGRSLLAGEKADAQRATDNDGIDRPSTSTGGTGEGGIVADSGRERRQRRQGYEAGRQRDGDTAGREQGDNQPTGQDSADVADAASGGLGTDRGARYAGHADERGENLAKPAKQRLERAGGERRKQFGIRKCVGTLPAGGCWPSRPGEPQFDWESPRLSQFPLGGLIDGIPARLVRRANKDGLKAYGNSIVPQVAAVILRWIGSNP